MNYVSRSLESPRRAHGHNLIAIVTSCTASNVHRDGRDVLDFIPALELFAVAFGVPPTVLDAGCAVTVAPLPPGIVGAPGTVMVDWASRKEEMYLV